MSEDTQLHLGAHPTDSEPGAVTNTELAELPPRPRRLRARVARAAQWASALTVVAVVGAGYWLATRPEPGMVQGMADADSINVSAKLGARVEKLLVHEGDRVEQGQLLFTLDSPETAAKERQVLAALDAARAVRQKSQYGSRREEVQLARANWQRAEAAAELARSSYARVEKLYEQKVVTRQSFDEASTQLKAADATAAAGRAQYDLALAGTRREDRDAAEAQVRQAEGALAEVKAARDEVNGRAPRAGYVDKRLADEGELVPAAYPVFTLVDLSQVWVALSLKEDQLRGVAIGKVLHGDVPALGLSRVAFEVYYLRPSGDFATWRSTRQSAGYDVKTFEIRVRPRAGVPGLRPGMSVLFPWPQP